MKNLNVIFMGTPEFSVPVLEMLIKNTNVIMAVTQPDKEVGRKRILTPSPVKQVALDNNIEVFTPFKLKNESEKVLEKNVDLIVTCAFGQIVPKDILDCPRLGCINVHASLLPKYRGASPINAAIRDGNKYTGITIMHMDETLDTGNMISSKQIEIDIEDNYGTLSDKLSKVGAELLLETLPDIINGSAKNIPQDDNEANYVGLIKREDERIDFNKNALEVYNFVRSLNPTPLANIIINGEEMKIIECRIGSKKEGPIGMITSVSKDSFNIMCLDGEIEITKVKPFGKKEMLVRDYFNGLKKENLLNKKVGE